jgi:hypothetical protein
LGRLKSAIYARMEEMSFRSGAAAAGGVLAATGVAITLAVVLGGPGDAVASAPGSSAAVPSAASTPLAPASSSAQATPRPGRTTVPATAAGDYRPPPSPAATPASAARHVATPPPGGTPTPSRFNRLDRRWLRGHPDFRERPGWWRWHRSSAPGSWGQSPRHRRR